MRPQNSVRKTYYSTRVYRILLAFAFVKSSHLVCCPSRPLSPISIIFWLLPNR